MSNILLYPTDFQNGVKIKIFSSFLALTKVISLCPVDPLLDVHCGGIFTLWGVTVKLDASTNQNVPEFHMLG